VTPGLWQHRKHAGRFTELYTRSTRTAVRILSLSGPLSIRFCRRVRRNHVCRIFTFTSASAAARAPRCTFHNKSVIVINILYLMVHVASGSAHAMRPQSVPSRPLPPGGRVPA
jgi:hypothetical protein